jgi:Ca2+-binding RTX toxin-like protein
MGIKLAIMSIPIISIISLSALGQFQNFSYGAQFSNDDDPFFKNSKNNGLFFEKAPGDEKAQQTDENDDGAITPDKSKNVIVGTDGDDFLEGIAQRDIIYGLKGNDQIYGFDGNDKLVGGKRDDIIDGGPGNDSIYGKAGNDFLAGNTGSDTLISGEGDDILRGRNAFTAEAEPDSFNCGKGTDTIDDFNSGEGDRKTNDCE